MRRPAFLVATAVVAVAVTLADRRSAVGAVLVLAFLAVAPGAAVARLGRFPEAGAASWAITIATSFAVDVLVVEAMLYARIWLPERALVVLAALTVALVGLERAIARGRWPARRASPKEK